MRWLHPDHPGRPLRLAYCLNLHAARDLAGLYEGLESITLPLRESLAPDAAFGVGMWFPASVARALAADSGRQELERLASFLGEHGLDPFTFNAFPYEDFQRAGLKADVYRPTWLEEERVRYTLDVAAIAARLNGRAAGESAHVSISTHPGTYGAWIRNAEDLVACARNLARAVRGLAEIEARGGPLTILSLEAEPLASAGDSRELAGFLAFARAEIARELGSATRAGYALAARHIGTCLDACHSAVEFEVPEEALALATQGGPLGKLQFSSALALPGPAAHPAARAELLALAEERFLHQIVGRSGKGLVHAEDLPALERSLGAGEEPWLECDEWRCHFHVPVDLARMSELATTREHADQLLRLLLTEPERWPTRELHVEIETYTWDVLPRAARGPGELVEGLAREYRHVMLLLAARGWRRA
jgi:hypothetical protein